MGDYDSCTEKYFRICSRAPIPDMHIARESGIQLLPLQTVLAVLRTYFAAMGASVYDCVKGHVGLKSPGLCRNTQLAPSLCREEAYCRLPSPFASAALTPDEEKIPPDTFSAHIFGEIAALESPFLYAPPIFCVPSSSSAPKLIQSPVGALTRDNTTR